MHWTLLTLLGLCGLGMMLNLALFAFVRSVRIAGLLICGAWMLQQAYWWLTGSDSFALFLACDIGIIAWFVTRRRAFDASERLIAASIPITTALAFYEYLNGGHTIFSWWVNWYLVAAQMIAGLPVTDWFVRIAAKRTEGFDVWRQFDLMVLRRLRLR